MSGLVFVHGAGDSAAVWAYQLAHFASRPDLLAIDLPGHGSRLTEAPHASIAANAAEVVAALDQSPFEAPVLMGHGMGGAIALQIALEFPDRFGALVLVASGARLPVRDGDLALARSKLDSVPAGAVCGSLTPVADAVSHDASNEVRRWVEQTTGQATAQTLCADLEGTDGFDASRWLRQITLPVLIVAGRDDRFAPPPQQHYLAEHLADARRTMVLAGAGHYVMAERPGRVNGIISEFLADLVA